MPSGSIMIGVRAGIAIIALFATASATAETVLVEAGRDATLIEEPDGALANGAGPVFFAGRTNQSQNGVRRGVIYFDVAAVLPANARVESVRLTLYMMPSNSARHRVSLHRLLTDWGEGASYASGGGGDFSTPGDATWMHTFYDDESWVRRGGHFVARSSVSRDVIAPAFYTWGATQKMLADVRLWIAAPHQNFGWILLGDETIPGTAKSFASREEPDPSLRPALELTYYLHH
jgi:hypothetical protein